MIRSEFIERLRAQADIIYIINELVPLTKAGTTHKACCPFHQEHSPSFSVSDKKQIYKCFGCGAGGDVFAFVKAFKRCEFHEAVEYIASRYNQQVDYEPTKPKPRSRFHNLKL